MSKKTIQITLFLITTLLFVEVVKIWHDSFKYKEEHRKAVERFDEIEKHLLEKYPSKIKKL
jgi:hypothetical protein